MDKVELPPPSKKGVISVEEAIDRRSSIRAFKDKEIPLKHISQILWAAQGKRGIFRTAPSAGATYPLHILLQVRKVETLLPGMYEYKVREHALTRLYEGDISEELCRACLGQEFIKEAPSNVIICATFERTTKVYGKRGIMYVHIEVGHVAENIYLQCYTLGLATCAVGAFIDEDVKKLLHIEATPLYVMPIGYPR